MSATFKGGIHPSYNKALTNSKAIETLSPPEELIIPLSQHIGAHCEPIVNVGDEVKLGQKIAESASPVSAPVHASVSGVVKAIEPREHQVGTKCMSIVITNDFNDTMHESVVPCNKAISELSSEEIFEMAKEGGIVGMGGAGFPLSFKLSSGKGKVDTLVINGAECEPYLSSDHRVMVEKPQEVIEGTRIAMKALGLTSALIGVETNKPDAIAALKEYIGADSDIKVVELDTKYPQGSEKMIIYATTGRKVPMGKLPSDVGCCVCNVDTMGALYRKYKFGVPSYERVVTVTGNIVGNPSVYLIRVGTPFQFVLDNASGVKGDIGKVISGGPMMGKAQHTTDVPVIKTTSGILVLSTEEAKPKERTNCIRCGKCIEVCNMRLQPVLLNFYSTNWDLEELEKLAVEMCCECGSCAFTCPARIELSQTFKLGKMKLQEQRREQKALKEREDTK